MILICLTSIDLVHVIRTQLLDRPVDVTMPRENLCLALIPHVFDLSPSPPAYITWPYSDPQVLRLYINPTTRLTEEGALIRRRLVSRLTLYEDG